ncbi:MAG: hypothetical protein IKC26_01305 [Clostridia bacterium]|nr:hypothetical protein [Clostridia bacterium]
MNVNSLTSLIPESVNPAVIYAVLVILVVLALYGLVTLIRRGRDARGESKDNGAGASVGNPDDAAIAAAIAASIVVTEDQALTAAITAAVAVYLEMENGGKSSLPTGFRVVSFKKRGGAWNRSSK